MSFIQFHVFNLQFIYDIPLYQVTTIRLLFFINKPDGYTCEIILKSIWFFSTLKKINMHMHNLHWWKIYQLFVSKTKYFETVNQIRLIIIMGNAKLVFNRIHMWCTPTKQGTSDILGIIVRSKLAALIWYQNQIHTPTFWDMLNHV